MEHIAIAAGHAEHDADMAGDAESLTCNLAGDDVAGYRAGRSLASAVVDGIIPTLILRAKSSVHDAVRCTGRRSVCLAVLVQHGLEKAALRIILHNVQTLRKAGVVEINFDCLHCRPPFQAMERKSMSFRPRDSFLHCLHHLETLQKGPHCQAVVWAKRFCVSRIHNTVGQ